MSYIRHAAVSVTARMSLVATLATIGFACGSEGGQTAELSASDELAREGQEKSVELGTTTSALAAGTYALHPKGNKDLCLDVTWGKNADGTRVQVSKCNGGPAQQWTRSGDMWKIFGDKCLNLKGGSNRDGTRLQIWTCNSYDINNSWTLDGSQVQWKKNPKLCLDVADGALRDGTDVQVWTCNKDQQNINQLWSWQSTQGASAPKPTTPQPTSPAPKPAPAAPVANAGSGQSSAYLGYSPAGLDVAPYFWTWAQYGDYQVRTLKEGMQKVNLKSATISFELSNYGCAPKGEFASMGDDIKAFRKAGNRAILSYGGATDNPPYLQKACNDAGKLAEVIAKQMEEYTTHFLDFDIEGENLGDTSSNNRLVDALAILQRRYSDLYISYTLPVDAYSGMPSTAVSLIQRNIDKGVKISRVNLMTMDYGQMPPRGKTSADMVLGSIDVSIAQLKKLYPKVDEKSIYHMMGITPLIGQNDPPGSGSFYFTVSDAQAVAKYAKERGIGLLSFWGLMRDRAGSSSSNSNHSNTPQKDFEFLNTFRSAQ